MATRKSKIGTITFATFHVRHDNFRHVAKKLKLSLHNFHHINFRHVRVNIHIYCKSGNSISLKLNMFIETKVAKVTWQKLLLRSCMARFRESYNAQKSKISIL